MTTDQPVSRERWIFEHVIAPLLVGAVGGIVVLGGQWVIQPSISRQEHFDKSVFDAKRDVYVRAIRQVNQKFESLRSWAGTNVSPGLTNVPPTPEPEAADVNLVYGELFLFSTPDIVRDYVACFGTNIAGPNRVEGNARLRMMNQMRRDLGINDLNLRKEDYRFWIKP